jgi:hypothetical protein
MIILNWYFFSTIIADPNDNFYKIHKSLLICVLDPNVCLLSFIIPNSFYIEGEKNTKWRRLGIEMRTFEVEFGKRIGDGQEGYRIMIKN